VKQVTQRKLIAASRALLALAECEDLQRYEDDAIARGEAAHSPNPFPGYLEEQIRNAFRDGSLLTQANLYSYAAMPDA
jgi:hypothetical protein